MWFLKTLLFFLLAFFLTGAFVNSGKNQVFSEHIKYPEKSDCRVLTVFSKNIDLNPEKPVLEIAFALPTLSEVQLNNPDLFLVKKDLAQDFLATKENFFDLFNLLFVRQGDDVLVCGEQNHFWQML